MFSEWTCCYCDINKANAGITWKMKPICEKCFITKREESKMKCVLINGVKYINEVDYLKVVEEKGYLYKDNENWKESFAMIRKENEKHVKELKEKNGEIERLKEKLNSLKECKENPLSKFRPVEEWREENYKLREEIEKFKEHVEVLKNLVSEEKQYEDWCELYYEFVLENGNIKPVKQEMLVEDAHEIIGMDSDNWRFYSISKFKKEVK